MIQILFYALFGCQQNSRKPNDADGPSAILDSGDDTGTNVAPDTGSEDSGAELPDTGEDTTPPSTPYHMAHFKSTHNSYSGEERGSIHAQLDAGFRGLEFDIHDNDFQTLGDYQLGHHSPGGEVDTAHGNPNTTLLSDWLSHVKQWSITHPGHAPITITLDFKDDLTDNVDFDHGSMDRLNDILIQTLGNGLFAPMNFNGEWPTIDELRDRFIIVLSGHEESRQLYKRDRGHNPAIAINRAGKVIEVHDSGTGGLWYWTGQMRSDGGIEWKRHGSYDAGQKPAIALNNDGWFVEVHQSQSANTLWRHVGMIDDDYNLTFGPSEQYDSGTNPTIRFTNKDGFALREIHQSANTGLHWDWDLSLNPNSGEIAFGDHTQTNDPLHLKHRDLAQHWIEVSTASHRSAGNDTLLYETRFGEARIRYPQLAFVEYQTNNAPELIDSDTWFAAVGSGSQTTLATWHNQGFITRQWGFDENDSSAIENPPNFPATDYLDAAWYNTFCAQIGTEE